MNIKETTQNTEDNDKQFGLVRSVLIESLAGGNRTDFCQGCHNICLNPLFSRTALKHNSNINDYEYKYNFTILISAPVVNICSENYTRLKFSIS